MVDVAYDEFYLQWSKVDRVVVLIGTLPTGKPIADGKHSDMYSMDIKFKISRVMQNTLIFKNLLV